MAIALYNSWTRLFCFFFLAWVHLQTYFWTTSDTSTRCFSALSAWFECVVLRPPLAHLVSEPLNSQCHLCCGHDWLIHCQTCWLTGWVCSWMTDSRAVWLPASLFLSDWFIHISSWLAILHPPTTAHPPTHPLCLSACLSFVAVAYESDWQHHWFPMLSIDRVK